MGLATSHRRSELKRDKLHSLSLNNPSLVVDLPIDKMLTSLNKSK
jgi:hypothetical protein